MRSILLTGRLSLVAALMAASAARGEDRRVDLYGDPLPAGALARFGTLRLRTTATELAGSADGRTLITAAGNVIGRWDAVTGRLREEKSLPISDFLETRLSPDGKALIVREESGLALWDLGSRRRQFLALSTGRNKIYFEVAGDKRTLVIAEEGENAEVGPVGLWDMVRGKVRSLEAPVRAPHHFCFDGERKRLYGASWRGLRCCWDLATGRLAWQTEHGSSHIALSPDGQTLATVTEGRGPVALWDAVTGKPIGSLEVDTGPGWMIAFSPDSEVLACSTYAGLFLWDFASRTRICCIDVTQGPVAFNPGGRSIFSLDRILEGWDAATGKPLFPEARAWGHVGTVDAIAFAPDGRTLASYGADGTIRLWDRARGTPRLLRSDARKSYPEFPVTQQVAFSPDGRLLVVGLEGLTLALHETASGKEVRRFSLPGGSESPEHDIAAVGFAQDGPTLLALRATRERPIGRVSISERLEPLRGWSVETGREVFRTTVPCGVLDRGELSPDGRFAIFPYTGPGTGLYSLIRGLREVRTGRLIPFEGGPKMFDEPFAFSPDGRLVAVAVLTRKPVSPGSFQIYETLTGRPLIRLRTVPRWCPPVFSPDGRLLVTNGEQSLEVWEVATGRALPSPTPREPLPNASPERFATSIAMAPDGRAVATGHADGTILLWDLTAARAALTRPRGPIDAEACWGDLAASSPRTALTAAERLVAAPDAALPLLRRYLRPEILNWAWLKARLEALDSESFDKREAATAELEGVLDKIEEELRKAREQATSAEVRQRIDRLLGKSRPPVPPADTVRSLRALAVVERIGTAEARALLRSLADGAPSARLTQEARSALRRLDAVVPR